MKIAAISPFEFAAPGRIIFGAGKFTEVGPIALGYGKRILLVTGGRSTLHLAEQLTGRLITDGAHVVRYPVSSEPDLTVIQRGRALGREHEIEVVIGLGGGSVMDTAKALSALLANDGDLFDYLEVIGRGQPIENPALPCICIPTTSGTGSEVTKNAVISAPEQQVKASMRSPLMLAKVAVVDPELTYLLPPEVTAYTGLDAITQLIEPYVSRRATVLSDALVRSALPYALALPVAYAAAQAHTNQGENTVGAPIADDHKAARSAMSYASLCGGLALANSGLGAVHGFAAVIGARYPIPHGACCGILIPHVVAANQDATANTAGYAERWATIAGLFGTTPDGLADALHKLTQALNMPGLAHYGVSLADIPELVTLAQKASSMKANPVDLPASILTDILEKAL